MRAFCEESAGSGRMDFYPPNSQGKDLGSDLHDKILATMHRQNLREPSFHIHGMGRIIVKVHKIHSACRARCSPNDPCNVAPIYSVPKMFNVVKLVTGSTEYETG